MKEKLVIFGWTFWDFSKIKVWTRNTDIENFSNCTKMKKRFKISERIYEHKLV